VIAAGFFAYLWEVCNIRLSNHDRYVVPLEDIVFNDRESGWEVDLRQYGQLITVRSPKGWKVLCVPYKPQPLTKPASVRTSTRPKDHDDEARKLQLRDRKLDPETWLIIVLRDSAWRFYNSVYSQVQMNSRVSQRSLTRNDFHPAKLWFGDTQENRPTQSPSNFFAVSGGRNLASILANRKATRARAR
jgi:hypothetical protein